MDIQDVEQLKARLKEEYEKDMEAIERVTRLLSVGITGITVAVPSSPYAVTTTVHGADPDETDPDARYQEPKENPGVVRIERRPHSKKGVFLRPVARAIVPRLPETFTKLDVQRLAIMTEPRLAGKIKENALAGTMRSLVEEDLIFQVEPATGRKAAVYKKKKPIHEAVKSLFTDDD
jgi:hypothetical protein